MRPLLRLVAGDLLALALLVGALTAVLALAISRAPTTLTFAADRPPQGVVFRDFDAIERNATGAFRWSRPQAALTLPLPAPGDYRLSLFLQESRLAPPARPISFAIDGQPIVAGQLEPGLHEYPLSIRLAPSAWLTTEGQVVEVALATTPFTAPGDARMLGVNLVRLSLTPVPAGNPWRTALFGPTLPILVLAYGMLRLLGAAVGTATGILGGLVAALAFVALGGHRGALALALLPAAYPLATAGVLALLAALGTVASAVRAAWRGTGAGRGHGDGGTATVGRARLAPASRRDLILALFLLLCFGAFLQKSGYNEDSRFDLIRALVDDRSTSIDPYADNTADKAFANGHFRSDKAPGSAFLGAPIYALARGLTALAGLPQPDPDRFRPLVAFGVAGIPTVLVALLLVRFLRPRTGEGWALAVGAGYALGTMAWPLGTMLFGHAAAACFLFAAFVQLAQAPHPAPRRAPVFAGLLAGWAVLVEFPAALGVAALLVYAASRARAAPLLMALGALPAVGLLLVYNQSAFGTPFTVGYAHLTDANFSSRMGEGLLGTTLPRWDTLAELLIGRRSLLRFAPWLLFATVGAWAGWRRGFRREVVACAAVVVAFLTFCAGYYASSGHASPGPRFLLPALPFAAALVGLAPRRWYPFVGAQLLSSAILAAMATATEPKAWDALADPLAELWLPRFLAGRLVNTTVHVHWGWQGGHALLLLAAAGLVTLVALALSTHPHRRARRAATFLTIFLFLLVLACGIPLDTAGWATGAADVPVHAAIVAVVR